MRADSQVWPSFWKKQCLFHMDENQYQTFTTSLSFIFVHSFYPTPKPRSQQDNEADPSFLQNHSDKKWHFSKTIPNFETIVNKLPCQKWILRMDSPESMHHHYQMIMFTYDTVIMVVTCVKFISIDFNFGIPCLC